MLKRCVVIDVGEGLLELVNPKIVWSTGECGAAPRAACPCPAAGAPWSARKSVAGAAPRIASASPLKSRARAFWTMALCHEIDHLDGIIYIDKMIEDVTDQYETEDEE